MNGLQGESLLIGWDLARASGKTQKQYAEEIGLTLANLTNRLRAARFAREVPRNPDLFQTLNLGSPFQLVGDFVIAGDIHVPYTDYDFAQRINIVGEKELKKPRKLLLAGDVFSMENFSSYASVSAEPTWAQERDALRQLLREWFQVFDVIYGLMGNHERRMQKWAAGAFDESDIMAMVYSNPDKLKWSNYPYCSITSGGVEWRVTHPSGYSQVSLSVAEKLALKHQVNVITHHEHHCGMGFDRYGHYVIVNNGCLADVNKMPYTALADAPKANMMKAFCLLRNGVPKLYSDRDDFTDWREYALPV